jgi:hypothetical protein
MRVVVPAALAVEVALAIAARAGRPEPSLGSEPEGRLFGRKLFRLAQASSSVRSTENCSLDK